MRATVGDQILVHGDTVGHHDRRGEVLEVRGNEGEPPYLVRFEDGHTGLLVPGPDAIVVPAQRGS
ncbi:DUF1918 domain-containing protein [Planomonospora algeriensis]